ncbi:MAG: hypothetical protein CL940_07760 [Deltaproteobacteria bacterium]|nr:hypothetical protein [Deltaproteobacteria bacterium]
MKVGLMLLSLALLVACGSGERSDALVVAPDAAVDSASLVDGQDVSELVCPTGQVMSEEGLCKAAGLQHCAPKFIDPLTGLCAPGTEHCPPVQVPIFTGDDQGCRAVGIPDCDPMFISGETGLCDPKPEHCPAGQIPVFTGEAQGCRVAGVVGCHADHVDEETGLCDPAPETCGPDAIPTPLGGCEPLEPSEGCGAGTWGSVEEQPGDVHVDLTYTGGASDGSRQMPWVSISQAVGTLQPGQRMILAAGTYDEGVILDRSVSMIGRCSSMVSLTGTLPGFMGETVVQAQGYVQVTVSDLTISGAGTGLVASDQVMLTLERVRLVGNHDGGLYVSGPGATVEAKGVLISASGAPAGAGGFGLAAQLGAKVSLASVALIDNVDRGVAVYDSGSSVGIEDSVISEIALRSDGQGGWGADVQGGGSLVLKSTVLAGATSLGLFVSEQGSEAQLTDSVLSHTQALPDGTYGRGVSVQYGAGLVVERSAITDHRDVAIVAFDAGTTVAISGSLVARTEARPDGTGGVGLTAFAGASYTVEDSTLVDHRMLGVLIEGGQSNLTASGLLLARTQLSGDGTKGRGAQIQAGGSLSLDRSSLMENHELGASIYGATTTVSLRDALVARTQPRADGKSGRGLGVEDGGHLTLERVALVDNRDVALWVHGAGSSVEATDVWIGSTDSEEGAHGSSGIGVQGGGALALERAALVNNRHAGVFVLQYGSEAALREVLIEGTLPDETGKKGRGAGAQEGARMEIDRSVIRDNHEMAIWYLLANGSVHDTYVVNTVQSPEEEGAFADGLLASGSDVDVDNLVSRDNSRVGVLYDRSEGDVRASLITGNGIGLLDQGVPGASIAGDLLVQDNLQNVLQEQTLEIPQEQMGLPELPTAAP